MHMFSVLLEMAHFNPKYKLNGKDNIHKVSFKKS